MPAKSAEIAFILAAWSPTSVATSLAKSATRLAAMAARSTARFGSSAGFAGAFFVGDGAAGFAIFAPKNQTPAAKPTPSATHAQSKFTRTNVPMAAGRRNIVSCLRLSSRQLNIYRLGGPINGLRNAFHNGFRWSILKKYVLGNRSQSTSCDITIKVP